MDDSEGRRVSQLKTPYHSADWPTVNLEGVLKYQSITRKRKLYRHIFFGEDTEAVPEKK